MSTPPAPGNRLPVTPFTDVLQLLAVARPITVTHGLGAGTLAIKGVGLVTAITWVNSAATAAMKAYLQDGDSAPGDILAVLVSAAGAGGSITPAAPGIYFQRGLQLNVISGSPGATVTYLPLLYPL